jgi:hypothetical protein
MKQTVRSVRNKRIRKGSRIKFLSLFIDSLKMIYIHPLQWFVSCSPRCFKEEWESSGNLSSCVWDSQELLCSSVLLLLLVESPWLCLYCQSAWQSNTGAPCSVLPWHSHRTLGAVAGSQLGHTPYFSAKTNFCGENKGGTQQSAAFWFIL